MAYSCNKCITDPCGSHTAFNAVRKKIAEELAHLRKCVKRAFKRRDSIFEWRWTTVTNRYTKMLAQLRQEVISVQKVHWCIPRLTLLATLADLIFGDTVAARKQAEALYDEQCGFLHEEQQILLKPLIDFWQKASDARDRIGILHIGAVRPLHHQPRLS